MGKQEDLIAAVKDQDLAGLVKLSGKISKSKLIGSVKKLNFNHLDSNGLSLLHHAATSDNSDILKILIEHGATVDAMDSQGIRPLHVAARLGNSRSVAHLIICGASVNDPAFDGSTPLHVACEQGHLETVKLLLHNQGDPTAYNREHKTAFDVACEFGHLKVVEKLASSALCSPLMRDYKQRTRDVKRTTCLHLAARNGHVNVLRFLLEAGFDVSRQTVQGTCLHEAVLHGQMKAVKFLLDWGVNIHCRNSANQTAVDILLNSPKLCQNEKLARLLSDAPFQPLTVRAIRSYHCPQQPNQLIFREGDLIRVVERRSDETWKGYLFGDSDGMQQQHIGYFPASEVEILRSTDASDEGLLSSVRNPSPLSTLNSSQFPASSHQLQCLSPVHQHLAKLSPVSSSTDRTAEWIVQSVDATDRLSGSPMSSKDNVSESNRSSTSSSSGSSGYLGSSNQVNSSSAGLSQLNRLSGQSCESGVASLWPSTHCLPVSTSRSSHSGLDWLDENGHGGAPASINDLIQQGLKDSDVMYVWLHQLQLADCYQLFVQAGYDMPTISRMTPEDLTAIGITQPNVRKHLTSEISRLHLNDQIPNYRPGSLLEWLQLLNLEEYHSSLVQDGYTGIDQVTGITWEDLEDIGIHKLGHQKKFMLAIDRLKKLNSAKQAAADSLESSTSRVECPPSADVKPAFSETIHPPGTPRSGGKSQEVVASIHPHESSSGENSAKQTRPKIPENKSGPQARNVIRLPPQTPFVSPSAQATHAQTVSHAAPSIAPELIAIQVNRAAGPRTGSIKERSSDKSDPQHVMYKSFHGRPSREFSGVLVETEGETTPTNDRSLLSVDEADELANRFRPQLAPKPDCDSFRRASASGIMNAAEIASALQKQNRRFFPHDVGYRDQLMEFSVRNSEGPQLSPGISYGSAPTTPSHSTLTESSCSPRPKKAVPPPPKRSNSIKDKNTSNSTNSKLTNAKNSPDPSHRDLSKSENTAAHQLALGDVMSHTTPSGSANVGAKPKLGGCAPSSELDNPLTRVIARLEWKDDQVVRPTKMKEFARTVEVCPPAPSARNMEVCPPAPSARTMEVCPPAPSSVSNTVHLNRSNSDCNTLPFANENIGTIKQRTPAKSTVVPVNTGDLHDRSGCSQNLTSSSSPRRLSQGSAESALADGRLQQKSDTRKPPPVPSKKPSLGKTEEPGSVAGQSGVPDGSDVFDDIDTLFQGLTQELNQMLTLNG